MIYNKTRKTLLSKNHKLCKSGCAKIIGLMFRRKPYALAFVFGKEKIIPLHMFFVFFPIDVIYLNKCKKIVELKEGFEPFRFYNPTKKAMYVLELPAGTIQKTKTSLGDKISF